jgi:hypothetical protein
LIENEALNSTIAVHEQLVLTQKMATAQALALAGLTKKPRVGSGGAGTVAKRMTKANPNCQGIITAATAAAVGGANAAAAAAGGGVSGLGNAQGGSAAAAAAAAAASQPGMLELAPQIMHPSTAKHISPGFDIELLSQAAAAAASDAAMLAQQQRQQQRQGSSSNMTGQTAGLGGMDQFGDLAGTQGMYAHQQQQQFLQQQQQQQLAGMAGDPGAWGQQPGGFLQQQGMGVQQLGGYAAAAAAGRPGGGMGMGLAPGPAAAADADQQQEAVRAMQLAALQGYLQVGRQWQCSNPCDTVAML